MSHATIPVLVPPTEITEKTFARLEEALAPHLDASGPGIVLDLLDVEFINSSALGALVRVGMRLDGAGRRLAFARPNKTIERTLRLVGLDAKMPLYRSIDDAFGSLGASAAPQGS